MERAEELRPGSRVAARTRQRWLCEVDGMLRERFFRPSGADSREGVGADLAWDDGLRDDDVLLVPPPFDSLYPHYLCAMTDAALGENDRRLKSGGASVSRRGAGSIQQHSGRAGRVAAAELPARTGQQVALVKEG